MTEMPPAAKRQIVSFDWRAPTASTVNPSPSVFLCRANLRALARSALPREMTMAGAPRRIGTDRNGQM
jgi:hypothetical protein